MAKLTPASPNPKLYKAKKKNELAVESKKSGIEQIRSRIPYTHFPPYLSVRIPAGNLNIAPVKTGIPINHPIFTGPQLKTWLFTKKVTNTPFSIQTAKHTVKASVFKNNIRWDFMVATCSIQVSFELFSINFWRGKYSDFIPYYVTDVTKSIFKLKTSEFFAYKSRFVHANT